MIICKNLSFAYEGHKQILDHISFSISKGESVGIIGANGAGKSTLMKILLGLLKAQGELNIAGLAMNKENIPAIRRHLGYVLQDSDNQLFMSTVYQDLSFGPRNQGIAGPEIEERIDCVLNQLDIAHLKNSYNHKLSGGEKRMAAIATILAMNPSVLIADEPTITLDPYHRRKTIEVLKKLDITKIIVSHDLDMIWETCNRVLLFSNGHIVADGPCKEILSNRSLLENNRLELPLRLQ